MVRLAGDNAEAHPKQGGAVPSTSYLCCLAAVAVAFVSCTSSTSPSQATCPDAGSNTDAGSNVCAPGMHSGPVSNLASLAWANGPPYSSSALGTFSPDPTTHYATAGMETDFSPAGCTSVKVLSDSSSSPRTPGVGAYGDPTQPPLFGIAKAYFDPMGLFLGYGWPLAGPAIWSLGWNPCGGKTELIGVQGLFSFPGWSTPNNAYPILAVTDDAQGGVCGYPLDAALGACMVSWQPDNPQSGTAIGGADSTTFDNTWTGVLYVQNAACSYFSALDGKAMSIRLHN
jgi:hypothetical protein